MADLPVFCTMMVYKHTVRRVTVEDSDAVFTPVGVISLYIGTINLLYCSATFIVLEEVGNVRRDGPTSHAPPQGHKEQFKQLVCCPPQLLLPPPPGCRTV